MTKYIQDKNDRLKIKFDDPLRDRNLWPTSKQQSLIISKMSEPVRREKEVVNTMFETINEMFVHHFENPEIEQIVGRIHRYEPVDRRFYNRIYDVVECDKCGLSYHRYYKNPDGTSACLCTIQKGATRNGLKICDICFEDPKTRGLTIDGWMNKCRDITHRYHPDVFVERVENLVVHGIKIDPVDVDETDVELVMMQTNCLRQAAYDALRLHNGDIVNAIMDLTV